MLELGRSGANLTLPINHAGTFAEVGAPATDAAAAEAAAAAVTAVVGVSGTIASAAEGGLEQPQRRSNVSNVSSEASSPKKPMLSFEVTSLPTAGWWERKRLRSKTWILASNYLMFVVVYLFSIIMLFTVILHSDPELDLLQAFYLSVSVATMTGLASVDMTKLQLSTEVLLAILIVSTSPMLMTLFPIMFRRRSFWLQEKEVQRRASEWDMGNIPVLCREHQTEYRALVHLTRTVLGYWVGVQLTAWLSLCAYFTVFPNPVFGDSTWAMVWWSLFGSISAFHNAGMTIRTNSLNDFNAEPCVLLVFGLLILLGNTFFPIVLRVILWTWWKTSRCEWRACAFRFLLDRPRRCYTHLFRFRQTVWLLIACVSLIVVQNVMSRVAEGEGAKVVTGNYLFMAISTRAAGLSSMDLAKLEAPVMFMYTVSMFIAASPVVVSMRSSTEVLDITGLSTAEEAMREKDALRSLSSVQGQATRFMTQHQLLLVILVLVVLQIDREVVTANGGLGPVLFEFASAYGTVGFSMSKNAASFSTSWTAISQLCLIIVMIMGRFRGHPEHIDISVDLSWSPVPSRTSEDVT